MKTVLVTGANRGIGFAIAKQMAEKNYKVFVSSRNLKNAQSAADIIGLNTSAVQLDVGDLSSIPEVIDQIDGKIDILINNAGVLNEDSLLENPNLYAESMNTMVNGPYHLIRACIPHMQQQKWGRIINISSGWGAFSEGLNGPGSYGVAKAALNALTKALSHQLPDYISINSVCPGWVRTRMGGEAASLTPDHGADTAVWLATKPDPVPSGRFFRARKEINW